MPAAFSCITSASLAAANIVGVTDNNRLDARKYINQVKAKIGECLETTEHNAITVAQQLRGHRRDEGHLIVIVSQNPIQIVTIPAIYPLLRKLASETAGCPVHAASSHEWAIARRAIRLAAYHTAEGWSDVRRTKRLNCCFCFPGH